MDVASGHTSGLEAGSVSGQFLLTLEQGRRRLNISRSKLYLEIAAGNLETVKNGVRRYVRAAEIDRYIMSLPRG